MKQEEVIERLKEELNLPFFNDLIWLLYNVIFTLYFLREDVFQHPLV